MKLFFEQATDHRNYKLTTDWAALDGYHAPSRDGAGSMDVKPASYTLDAVESPRNCCYFLWTLGARRALTFLEQQPRVDADRLGIYGYLIDIPKAVKLIETDTWRVVTSPHSNHQDIGEFEVGGLLWFDQHLKESFTYPASPETVLTLETPSGIPSLMVTPDTSRTIDAVDVYYSQDGDA